MEKLRYKSPQVQESTNGSNSLEAFPPHDVVLGSGALVRGLYPSNSMPEVPTISMMFCPENPSSSETFIKKFNTKNLKIVVERGHLVLSSIQNKTECQVLRVAVQPGVKALVWTGVWALQLIQQNGRYASSRLLHYDSRTTEVIADSGMKYVDLMDSFSNVTYVTTTRH